MGTRRRQAAGTLSRQIQKRIRFCLAVFSAALRLGVKMKSDIRQPADGDDRRFNPPEQPAIGVKRSHKRRQSSGTVRTFQGRYKIEFSSPALGHDPTRDHASDVSSTPIDAWDQL